MRETGVPGASATPLRAHAGRGRRQEALARAAEFAPPARQEPGPAVTRAREQLEPGPAPGSDWASLRVAASLRW